MSAVPVAPGARPCSRHHRLSRDSSPYGSAMRNKLIHTLILLGILILPARNGPAQSFGFTLQTRWSVPGGAAVHKLIFSPDGRWLAAAVDSQAKLFEMTADGPPREVGTISPGRSEITGLAFSPDGKTVAIVD